MNRFRHLFFIALLFGIADSTPGQDSNIDDSPMPPTQKMSAVSSQPVHPVLIRNEHGPLTRVVVHVENNIDARANSFVFTFDGTDDLGDLESLSLFSTGDKDEFSSVTRIGEPATPAREVTFHGESVLSHGKNVFWLSCELKASASLSNRVAATCTSIETSIGTLTPRDASPGAKHRIGVALRKHDDDGVHTYRIPALATSAKGTLLAVYDMRRRMGRDLQEDIDIGLSRSTDGGQTWPNSHHLLLDEGLGAGYPSLTRVDAEHVGIVYEGSQAHLVFEKLSLAELLNAP